MINIRTGIYEVQYKIVKMAQLVESDMDQNTEFMREVESGVPDMNENSLSIMLHPPVARKK